MKHILLVEDDARDAKLTVLALGQAGIDRDIVVVGDGAQALDYLFRRGEFADLADPTPALVVLDLKMPKIDGLEVLRQMRGDALLRPVPVVVLSSSAEDRDIDRSYESGANAFVVKPLRYQDYLATVREIGVFWTEMNQPPQASQARAGGAER